MLWLFPLLQLRIDQNWEERFQHVGQSAALFDFVRLVICFELAITPAVSVSGGRQGNIDRTSAWFCALLFLRLPHGLFSADQSVIFITK